MDPAIHQSFAFLLLVIIGVLFKFKIKDPKELTRIKKIILCIALPSTIFFVLLKTKLELSFLFDPLAALALNLCLFLAARYLVLPFVQKSIGSSEGRTILMLIPSLAPGLSCFPFIIEYLGDDALARAALADIGNKIFVLIILYMLAMHWYFGSLKKESNQEDSNISTRLKSLVMALIKEPINAMIVLAIVLLSFGYNYANLTMFMQELISRTHAITTSLVLIFIGTAMKVNKKEIHSIITFLLFRSGFTFLISALLLSWLGGQLAASIALIIVVFPQSSVSFWPFAHMSAVNNIEAQGNSATCGEKTFNLQLALNILAFSLPFSSLLILGICTTGYTFLNPLVCLISGFSLMGLALLFKMYSLYGPKFIKDFRSAIMEIQEEKKSSLVKEE